MKFIAIVIALAAILTFPTFVGSLIAAVTIFSAIGIAGAWIIDQNYRRRERRLNAAFQRV